MRIRREDVEHVREHSRIDEVVGEQVTLKSAGIGSMKGLCPLHDEKSPSFNVRPQLGLWHCFGCGEGGDVIAFVQKVDHLTFAEAVERLAARLGYVLHYEDDDGQPGRAGARRDQVGQRQRLVEAHRVAAQFYAEQLSAAPEALQGRHFLAERGFDREAAEHFSVGFSPRAGEDLFKHLRAKTFTEEELVSAGLVGRGQRGLYDRFRGRLMWPIRDVTGDVVGFGARRLFDDDRIDAKYLNTPDTAIYKKSQVLYGVDLAKKEIARTRQVVVVEGYTDVMACHLAGVETAVATCGTAFAADHVRVVRRLLGDDGSGAGEVIFTFDGDAAGQKAALRAFEEDQRFVAQTYVAVAKHGMDPCELRQQHGDEAVRELVQARQPLFEFAIRSTLREYNLETAEGRVNALRATAPLVAGIRDGSLRPEYVRQLAGWLGMDREPVARMVTQGGGKSKSRPDAVSRGSGQAPPAARSPRATPRPDPRDPVARVEREALECMLQVPALVPAADADALGVEAFEVPAFRVVFHAIRSAGGMAAAVTSTPSGWAEAVREAAPDAVASLVTELAVTPLPADTDEVLARYASSVVLRVAEIELARTISTMRSRLQRLPADDPQLSAAQRELFAVEAQRRALKERIAGA